MKNDKIFLLLLLPLIFMSVTAIDFYGSVQYANSTEVNATNVSVQVLNMSNNFAEVATYTALSNESGYFNVTAIDNHTDYLYGPAFRLYNDTTNQYANYVGASLPQMNSLALVNNVTFYLRAGAAINVSAIYGNGSGTQLFNYQLKDVATGFFVSEQFTSYVDGALINVPANRNYSMMIYPNQSAPLTHNIYDVNLTDGFHSKEFNCSTQEQRQIGYVNVTNGTTEFESITAIAFNLEPGRMIYRGDNVMALYNFTANDAYTYSSGFYNISVEGTAENSSLLLFVIGELDGEIYGGFQEVYAAFGTDYAETNLTLYKMLGSNNTMSVGYGSGAANITYRTMNFTIYNSTGSAISDQANVDFNVNYEAYGMTNFTWMIDVDSADTGVFNVPLLNMTGTDTVNLFTMGGAPARTKFTAAQLNSGTPNITIKNNMNMEDPDGAALGDIFIDMIKFDSTCTVPNYNVTGCSFFGAVQDPTSSTFNPFRVVMSGATLNFLMRNAANITVMYVNVDLLASGPPDAMFDDSAENDTSDSTSFKQAWKFGSSGPSIYDYIIIGAPYTPGNSSQTGFNESVNMTINIPYLYDNDWNVVWNYSRGDNITNITDNEDLSEYRDYLTTEYEAYLNGTNVTCNLADENLSSGLCYQDTDNDMIWLKILHFSGLGPNIEGDVITADAAADTTTTTSPSASGASTTVTFAHTFSNIAANTATSVIVDKNNMSIKKLTLTLIEDITAVQVNMKSFASKPSGVDELDEVYKYLEITVGGVTTSKIDDASIQFEIPESWLYDNNVTRRNVVLLRWIDSDWKELTTTFISSEDDINLYKATTPGFSYFAIGAKERVAAENSNTAETPSSDTPETQESGSDNEQTNTSDDAPLENNQMYVIVAIIVIAILGYFFYTQYGGNTKKRRTSRRPISRAKSLKKLNRYGFKVKRK
jgi:PGF-pre-PGF domain-containing protein